MTERAGFKKQEIQQREITVSELLQNNPLGYKELATKLGITEGQATYTAKTLRRRGEVPKSRERRNKAAIALQRAQIREYVVNSYSSEKIAELLDIPLKRIKREIQRAMYEDEAID